MNKTTIAFLQDISRTPALTIKHLDNLVTQKQTKIVLDLFCVKFDFESLIVTLEYYVEDEEYPNATFSFEEFINLLNNNQKK